MLKTETKEKDKNVKHKDGFLKVERKSDNDSNNEDNKENITLTPTRQTQVQIKKDKDNVFISNRPLHPHNRFRRQTKEGRDDDDVTYVNKRLQPSQNRLKQKNKKLEFDAETLTEIPFIIIVPLNTKETSACKNKITDHIIKHFLSELTMRDYIEHEEGSNTFKTLEDPQQKRTGYQN